MERRNLTGLAVAALIAGGLVVVGLGYGATSSTGPKACETAHHVLVLASRHAHCPPGQHVVRLGDSEQLGLRGLRGRVVAAGPDARSWNQINLNAPTVATPPVPMTITAEGPLTLNEQCWKDAASGNVTAKLSLASTQSFDFEAVVSRSIDSESFSQTRVSAHDVASYPLVTSVIPSGNTNDAFLNPVLIWFGSAPSVYSISAHVYLDSANKLCTFGGIVFGSPAE